MPRDQRPPSVAIGAILGLGLAQLRKIIPVWQYEYPEGLSSSAHRSSARLNTCGRRSLVGSAEPEESFTWTSTPALAHAGCTSFSSAKRNTRNRHGKLQGGSARSTLSPGVGVLLTARVASWPHISPRCSGTGAISALPQSSATPVLRALRAEHQAHRFSRPGSADCEWAKRQVMEAFCPRSPSWRESTVEQGLAIVKRAVEVCYGRK